ncbi:MAG: hypothetical protein EBX88_06070, partial [Actinobacteria bacterium]|nr:hypothetical protein [Actinomycetota bacterium]
MILLSQIPLALQSVSAHACYTISDTTIVSSSSTPGVCAGDLVIPEGITLIGDNAFINQTSITSLVLPNSLQNVGNGAFFGADNLR